MKSKLNSIYQNNKLLFVYTLIFLGLMCFMIVCMGEYSIVGPWDATNSYFPSMVYCGKYIKQLFINFSKLIFEIPLFDFSIGFGEDIITSLNWSGFGDPFMLIAGILPTEMSMEAYVVMTFCKLYFAGITYIIYCIGRKIENDSIIATVFLYVMCSYALFHGFQYLNFANVLVYFPLLLAGIDDIIYEKKKLSFKIFIALFFQGMTNFYFLYMMLLFAAIYAFVCIICKTQNIKVIISCVLRLLYHVVLGVALSSVIFIPAVIGFFKSSRVNDLQNSFMDFIKIDFDLLWKTFSGLIVPNGYSVLDLAIPGTGIMFYLISFKYAKKKELKIFALFLIGCVVCQYTTSWIAGGFGKDVYIGRWMYVFSFTVAVLIAMTIDNINEIMAKTYIIYGVSVLGYMIILLLSKKFLNNENIPYKRYCIYLITILFQMILLYLIKRKKNIIMMKKYVICFLVFGVITNIFVHFGYKYPTVQTQLVRTYYTWEDSVINQLDKNVVKLSEIAAEEQAFYRVDLLSDSIDDSLYTGAKSCSEYISIMNSNIIDFYREYGITSSLKSRFCYTGVDGRDSMEDMLCVRFSERGLGKIEENKDAFPLGVTYSSYITEEEAKKINVIEKNEIVRNSLILNKSVQSVSEGNVKKDVFVEVKKQIYVNDNICFGEMFEVKKGDKLSFQIEESFKGEGYLYIEEVPDNIKGTICFENGYTKEAFTGNNMTPYAFICLEQIDKENDFFEIEFKEDVCIDLGKIHVFILSENMMSCEKKEMTNLDMGINSISGVIECNEPQILFMAIPYSSGWKMYVDGNETEILKANYGFMACELQAGKHRIEMNYRTPGIIVGIGLSLLSFIVIMFLSINNKIKMTKVEK